MKERERRREGKKEVRKRCRKEKGQGGEERKEGKKG
jgi:hypothetical protein